ncbi:MAG: hypothetical protein GC186_09840 [Rhodobacteraceae bacterium]|nr:hypothetical protein [Paracoccaceae bacterium]
MPVFDLYSKRRKRQIEKASDVFIYDEIPEPLRVQIVQMWDDAIGNEAAYHNQYDMGDTRGVYREIVTILRREYGVHQLSSAASDFRSELRQLFLTTNNIDRLLDIIELSFRAIDSVCRDWGDRQSTIADETLIELNVRFREHSVGYRFEERTLLRVDTEYTHEEIIKPALRLLSGDIYSGAREEFLSAFEHYRTGKAKEVLNDCLKSLESTLKAICGKRGWQYNAKATAKDLISVAFDNKLIPDFWQSHFNALRTSLESSVPTGRNKISGHGQGALPTAVPDHLVSYMLNMTASTIVFLAKAEASIL